MDKNNRLTFRNRLIIKGKTEPSSARDPRVRLEVDSLPSSPLRLPLLGGCRGKSTLAPYRRNSGNAPASKGLPLLNPLCLPTCPGQLLDDELKLSPLLINKILPTIKEASSLKNKEKEKVLDLIQEPTGSKSNIKQTDHKSVKGHLKPTSPHFDYSTNEDIDWLLESKNLDPSVLFSIKLSPLKYKEIEDEFSDLDFLVKTSGFRQKNTIPNVFVINSLKPNLMPILKPTSPFFLDRKNTFPCSEV